MNVVNPTDNIRLLITTLFIYITCMTASAQPAVPKHEVRAVWLTTIGGLDWPHSYSRSELSEKKQKKELCDILDRLKAANINTVLLQTRIRGTVIYPSVYEPWDGCLSGIPGVSPGYDALEFAIEECHKRGMELHAWVVTIPVGQWNGAGCKALRKKRPGLLHRIGNEGFMNPEQRQTAGYLADICREITGNYDVDGIHLDYIRYPETWKIKVSREQGRRHITDIVRSINMAVKEIKPWVKISCSPIGKFDDLTRYWSHGWNAYTRTCQDAQGWMRDGLMDEVFPMMYFKDNQFFPFALDWKENSYGRIVAAGLGIYFMAPGERDWPLDIFKRKMNVLRSNGLGLAFFRSKFFTDDIKGIYGFTATEMNKYPALIPAMTWQTDITPSAPTSIHTYETADGFCISWSGASDRSDSPNILYNIYASPTYPVDITDARNLIAARHPKEHLYIETASNGRIQRYYYAVTAMNRYGNESEAASTRPAEQYRNRRLLENDGRTLTVPKKDNSMDADYLLVETMTGTIIATKPYTGCKISIYDIPEGMYTLRTLNRKGTAHRLGHFIIKRTKQR